MNIVKGVIISIDCVQNGSDWKSSTAEDEPCIFTFFNAYVLTMIEKQFTPKRTICRVTFKIPYDSAQEKVSVVGDFNDWNPKANRMEKNGEYWEALVRLKPDRKYKFKYLVDGEYWRNDKEADDYVRNPFGTKDSILVIGT